MLVRELKITYQPRPDLPTFDARRHLGNPREAAQFLRPILENEAVEVFGIVCLSSRHSPICWHEASRGTLESSLIHPREVFKAAILANAAGIILAHNHPSGDPTPSPDDVNLTTRLRAAADLIGIQVLDHIVIGDGRYCSFKETGRI